MQNILGSLRSPALFNIIVVTREGNFDMMQDFGAPKIAKLQELPGGFAPWSPTRAPPLTWLGTSPNVAPPNPKTWIRARDHYTFE